MDVPSAYAAEKTTEYEYGERIKLETPSAKGYVFTGWKETVPSRMPAKDVTVTGQWKKTFTLTYLLYMPNERDSGSSLVGTKTQELTEGEHALSELYTIKDFSVEYLTDGPFGGAMNNHHPGPSLKTDFTDQQGYLYLGWYLAPGAPVSVKAIERYEFFQKMVQLNREEAQIYVDALVEIVQGSGIVNIPVITQDMSVVEIDRILDTWYYDENVSQEDKDTLDAAYNNYDWTASNDARQKIQEEREKVLREYYNEFDPQMYDEQGNEVERFDFTKVASINITEDLTLFGFYGNMYNHPEMA